MGDLNEFSTATRLFLEAYPWRRIEPVPCVNLTKKLSDCRLALISSAGFVQKGQKPFDHSIKGGDVSFREIPSSIDVSNLIEYHKSKSFDHSGLHQDPNVAFPIDRVQELAESGRIGSVNHRHFSFSGVISAPGRLINKTAPEIMQKLVHDGVDIVILIPV